MSKFIFGQKRVPSVRTTCQAFSPLRTAQARTSVFSTSFASEEWVEHKSEPISDSAVLLGPEANYRQLHTPTKPSSEPVYKPNEVPCPSLVYGTASSGPRVHKSSEPPRLFSALAIANLVTIVGYLTIWIHQTTRISYMRHLQPFIGFRSYRHLPQFCNAVAS